METQDPPSPPPKPKRPKTYTKAKTGKEKMRKCLKCRKEFLSEGPANRLCTSCNDNYRGLNMAIWHR